jgi:hypothetical protein
VSKSCIVAQHEKRDGEPSLQVSRLPPHKL